MKKEKKFWGLSEIEYKSFDVSNKIYKEIEQLANDYLLGYDMLDKKVERYNDKVYLILLF
jgi:hypothetical protein